MSVIIAFETEIIPVYKSVYLKKFNLIIYVGNARKVASYVKGLMRINVQNARMGFHISLIHYTLVNA